mmetsp:Transcript_27430/g.54872  ORF Transcript_27430/g.54872 Transcript_27430/m.54872 type:complete len:780 (-) Transcript_27430:89-2428(-)
MSSPATARSQCIKLSPALWTSPRRKGRNSRARISTPKFCLDDFSPRNKTPSPKKRNGESRSDGSCGRNNNSKRKSPEQDRSSLISSSIEERSSPLASALPFRLDPKLSTHKSRTQFDSTLSVDDDSTTQFDDSSRQLFSAFACCENSDSGQMQPLRRSPRKPKPPVKSYSESTKQRESKVNSPPTKMSSSPIFSFLQPPQSASTNTDSLPLTPIAPPSSFVDDIHHGKQHYHRSPHWSGQVRVNPFSPIPDKYLNPPHVATKSVTSSGRKRRPSFEKSFQLPPPNLPSTEASNLHDEENRPFKMKRVQFLQPRQDSSFESTVDRESPKDVIQATMGNDLGSPELTIISKRKESPELSSPDVYIPDAKRLRLLKRGRYLDDFEEVSFLGSGSFGSVNVCLSRLDGCLYAIKSIRPNASPAINSEIVGTAGGDSDETHYLYGGFQVKQSNRSFVPPTPRRDVAPSPMRRKKNAKRLGICSSWEEKDEDLRDIAMSGSSHWTDSSLRRILREVHALAALCKKADVRAFHIVRYFQSWLEDDGTLYIQTELCSATLRDEMTGNAINGERVAKKNRSTSTPRDKIDIHRQFKILREMLLALELLHEQGMVHLDIKPENILIKDNMYKLGDFGLVHGFSNGDGCEKISSTSDVEEGDSRYMPKDLLSDDCKDLTKCDIFSLGATVYEVCSGKPLPSNGQHWQDLRNGLLSGIPFSKSPCLFAIIKDMMHPDPDKRPTASDLLSRKELSGGQENFFLHGVLQRNRSSSQCHNTKKIPRKRSFSWTS